jgi:hypothetical protein
LVLEFFAPVWPTSWPANGGGVTYWTYTDEVPDGVLMTGAVQSKVRGPTNQITFASLSATPSVRRLGRGKLLGIWNLVDPPEDIFQAEQTLVDVVAGCREPESARAELQPYLDWLHLNPPISRDLETHSPAFVAWLKAKPRRR